MHSDNRNLAPNYDRNIIPSPFWSRYFPHCVKTSNSEFLTYASFGVGGSHIVCPRDIDLQVVSGLCGSLGSEWVKDIRHQETQSVLRESGLAEMYLTASAFVHGISFILGPATRCDKIDHFAAILRVLEGLQPIADFSLKIAAVWPVSYRRWNVLLFSCDFHRTNGI